MQVKRGRASKSINYKAILLPTYDYGVESDHEDALVVVAVVPEKKEEEEEED